MRYILLLFALIINGYGSIGYISAYKGQVYIQKYGNIENAIKGYKLYGGETIITKDGVLQIVFKDKTVIKIGKYSKFSIDEYIYSDSYGSAKFRVEKGFFDCVTGKIGKKFRKNFKFRTKHATIGIRGTHFYGEVLQEEEKIYCLKGEIFVITPEDIVNVMANEYVRVTRFATEIPRKFETLEKSWKFIELEELNLETFESETKKYMDLVDEGITDFQDSIKDMGIPLPDF